MRSVRVGLASPVVDAPCVQPNIRSRNDVVVSTEPSLPVLSAPRGLLRLSIETLASWSCVLLLPYLLDLARHVGGVAPKSVNLNYVLPDPAGWYFQKPVFLGRIKKNAFALGKAMRHTPAPDALPGRLASTEPLDVVV